MNYEQQYPDVENIIDWNNPEPVETQNPKAQSGSLGLPADTKVGIFSNKGRLRADLYGALGRLSFNPNDLLKGNLFATPPLKMKNGLGFVDTGDALKQVAGILGIKDHTKLYDPTSSESYFVNRAIMDLNAKRAGMSMRFYEPSDPRFNERVLKYIANAEGKESNDTSFDVGGETIYGVTKDDVDYFPKGITVANMKKLMTREQAMQIHRDKYWNHGWNGHMAPKDIKNNRLAIVMMDTGINPLGPESTKLFAPGVASILNRRDLTDDQKADALMDFRVQMYSKYGIPKLKNNPTEQKKRRQALVNRIQYKLRPFVNSLPREK